MVAEGRFRQDLYYRLNVIPVTIPPLRERREDIPELLYHYLEHFNLRYGTNTWISQEAVDNLTGYDWPGNVRELANLVERLVILENRDIIRVKDLPDRLQNVLGHKGSVLQGIGHLRGLCTLRPLKQELEGHEKSVLAEALHRHPRQEDAARVLGISMSTLTRKLRKHGLNKASLPSESTYGT